MIPRAALLLLLLTAGGCATGGYRRLEPPLGPIGFGQRFGAPRAEVEATLRAAGVPFRAAAGAPDLLVADRCPGAPLEGPCRLEVGPVGLFAVEQEVPAADTGALVGAVRRGLGAPSKGASGDLVAAWEPPGWTVAVASHLVRSPPVTTLRAEFDAATPPTVSGVPLGRRRADVELALGLQGAAPIQRDQDASSYLGCPQGSAEAISCTVTFRGGRAAAVTEVLPGDPDDRHAMEDWRARAAAMGREIGRPPEVRCPPGGPDRGSGQVEGDCTATWSSERLLVVVGAHRSPGGQHRGSISVYLGFSYPPLGAKDED
jgi:hypothetical protein